jgi:hypothetical protein
VSWFDKVTEHVCGIQNASDLNLRKNVEWVLTLFLSFTRRIQKCNPKLYQDTVFYNRIC